MRSEVPAASAARRRGRNRHLRAPLVGLVLGLIAVLGAGQTPAAPDEEARIQAAFLYNFLKFVTWPDAAFSGATAPYVIGLFGENTLGAALDEARGMAVKGRTVEVRVVNEPDRVKACHILYIPRLAQSRIPAVFSALANSTALTVSDAPGFVKAGGHIEFVIVSDTVRFRANLAAAEQRGLKLSSQLLGVAIEVVR